MLYIIQYKQSSLAAQTPANLLHRIRVGRCVEPTSTHYLSANIIGTQYVNQANKYDASGVRILYRMRDFNCQSRFARTGRSNKGNQSTVATCVNRISCRALPKPTEQLNKLLATAKES